MILFFSGCGNSEFVANSLATLTDDKSYRIDVTAENPAYHIEKDEALGIVCPVYSWAVPRVVQSYLKRLQLNHTPSYLYLACTCGDSVGNTAEHFSKFCSTLGWKLDFVYSFIMPETYINLKGFNLDTPDGEKRKLDVVRQNLPLVAQRILSREKGFDVIKGKLPWINTHITNALFYKLLITDRKFCVSDACISCGICESSCPLHNIKMKNGRPSWNGTCTNCMSCYHRCPKNAISFGKATAGKGQYVFGHNSDA